MKYLKKFNQHLNYSSYLISNSYNQIINGDKDSIVSYCLKENEVHYNIPLINAYDYVEIGGVKWSTKNLGANDITDAGLFFHWGDTQGYTAEQCMNEEFPISYKYWDNDEYSITNEFFENYPSYTVSMLSSDDAAKAIIGGNWRVPSDTEWLSLTNNTNVSYTANYNNSNVPGYIFTDKLDNSKVLFLPAVKSYEGWYDSESSFPYEYEYGTYYWNNQQSGESGYAQSFIYDGDVVSWDSEALVSESLYYGLPIRPILDE